MIMNLVCEIAEETSFAFGSNKREDLKTDYASPLTTGIIYCNLNLVGQPVKWFTHYPQLPGTCVV